MTDLSAKFDALTTQLATQHSELMGVLSGLNTTLAGLAWPNINPMVADIAAIRAAVSPAGEALPIEAHASIVWSLYRIMDAIQPMWPRAEGTEALQPALNQILATLLPDLSATATNINNRLVETRDYAQLIAEATAALEYWAGTPPAGEDYKAYTLLQRIAARTGGTWESLGTLGSPAMGTALQLLACICDATTSVLPADPLDLSDPLACDTPYTSDGMLLLPWAAAGGTSQMFATFGTLPTGLSYGTTFELADDTSELQTGDWSKWRVFVQSDQPQYSDGSGPLSLARFPTNQWRRLDGSFPRAFSVDARGSIKVYLCRDEETCITSDGDAYVAGSTWGSAYILSSWPGGIDMADDVSFATGSRVILPNVGPGWVVSSLGGSGSVYASASQSASSIGGVADGAPLTLPAGVDHIYIIANSYGASFMACPPGVS